MIALLGIIVIVGGAIVANVGAIWMLVYAFQESALWGIGSLCFSPLLFVFAAQNWEKCKKPFFIWLIGFGVFGLGVLLFLLGGAGAVNEVGQ